MTPEILLLIIHTDNMLKSGFFASILFLLFLTICIIKTRRCIISVISVIISVIISLTSLTSMFILHYYILHDINYTYNFPYNMLPLHFFACILFLLSLTISIKKTGRQKLILKKNINTVDDIAINVTSTIPSLDEVVLLEEKALVYFKDIERALSSRFNCEIRLMACGSIPERFSVPITNDWIRDYGEIDPWNHALLSDQDFLIVPFPITASYSAQSDKIEIVQSESFTEEGYVKLRVNRCMPRSFNLKEGLLSTNTVKRAVEQCISKEPIINFLGVAGKPSLLMKVDIHGPAINVHITGKPSDVYLADFTFAIPCSEWPRISDWPSRNKMWPDHSVVATIKDLAFHFVPVNQKKDKSKLTWRYSFSLAERELSRQVSEEARNCFLYFKIISEDHLKPICKRLKTYHLKTILFHTLEVTPAEMWNEKNILNCLDYLLKELQEAFHQQRCRHFWISRINLFQDFKNRILSKLEAKIKEIRKNPIAFVGTYSLRSRASCQHFNKNEEVLSYFCLKYVSYDCILKDSIKKIRKNNSEEATAEEGNHVQASPEQAILNIDSYPVRSYGSFSQTENL